MKYANESKNTKNNNNLDDYFDENYSAKKKLELEKVVRENKDSYYNLLEEEFPITQSKVENPKNGNKKHDKYQVDDFEEYSYEKTKGHYTGLDKEHEERLKKEKERIRKEFENENFANYGNDIVIEEDTVRNKRIKDVNREYFFNKIGLN